MARTLRACGECAAAPAAGKGFRLCWWCTRPGAQAATCKSCGSAVARGGFFVARLCRGCHPYTRSLVPRSCPHCLAWGALRGTLCKACKTYARGNPTRHCRGCRRVLPARDGHCRLCWAQARLLEGWPRTDPRRYFGRLPATGHQLFLAELVRGLQLAYPLWRYQREHPAAEPPQSTAAAAAGWVQPRLFEAVRDYTRFVKARDANPANPALIAARNIAADLAERRGWSDEVRRLTDRGLVVVLSGHSDGETVRYSEVLPLAADRKVNVERLAEVLTALGVFTDDRPDQFEQWVDRRTADLAPGIAADVQAWLHLLRSGGPRSKPKSRSLTWGYLSSVRPALLEWSSRYRHLREVTPPDIKAVLDSQFGIERKTTHVALRSLFRFCRRNRTIFRDPTVGMVAGKIARSQILPLDQAAYREAVEASTSPDQRLLLALAAIHAAPRPAMRRMTLDDIDLPNRRITIGGHARPLDELTRRALLGYLTVRNRRWPRTANRHLFITRQTAHETGPASDWWFYLRFAGLSVTLEQIRIDRQLDEARAACADPLHLAGVFGVSEPTAIRYASAARALLDTDAAAEYGTEDSAGACRDPGTSDR